VKLRNLVESNAGITALNKRNKALVKRYLKTLETFESDAQSTDEVYGDFEEGFKSLNKKLEDLLDVMNKVLKKLQRLKYRSNMTNRILGSYYGAVIGDQTGQILEFLSKDRQHYTNVSDMLQGMKSGVWSDDTSMMLCTLKTLTKYKYINQKDLLDNFVKWYSTGYLTVNGTFDCGMTVSERLEHYTDTQELISPFSTDNKSGNGSLMRISPVTYVTFKNSEYLKDETISSSITTHSSRKSLDSCVLYTSLISQVIHGTSKEDLVNIFEDVLCTEVNDNFSSRYNDVKSNIFGFVIDSLHIALHSFVSTDDFDTGLLKCINYGGDTDTNAAIYGQLAGAYYGYNSLNKDFIESIKKKDLIDSIITEFVNNQTL